MSPAEPASGQSVPGPSYLSVFSLVRDDSPQFFGQLVLSMDTVRNLGWQPIAFGSSMTGMVDEWLELYRIPPGSPFFDKLASLEQEPQYQLALGLCRTRRLELTRAMPYDPGLKRPNGEQGHLLYSVLELKTDQEQCLIQAMAQLQALFREKTWSLVSASRSLTLPRYVVHLWQFDDAQLLHGLLEDERYAILERCCERQSHQLLRLQEVKPQ